MRPKRKVREVRAEERRTGTDNQKEDSKTERRQVTLHNSFLHCCMRITLRASPLPLSLTSESVKVPRNYRPGKIRITESDNLLESSSIQRSTNSLIIPS